jgi:hypothetical protein
MNRKSISDEPFLLKDLQLASQVWETSKASGFADNFTKSLEILTLGIIPYNQRALDDWIETVQDICEKSIRSILRDHYGSYIGDKVDLSGRILLSRSKILHEGIERYIICIVNIKIIKQVVKENAMKNVNPTIKKILDIGHQEHHGGISLYAYRINFVDWSKRFLKTMWRYWGHILRNVGSYKSHTVSSPRR